MRTPHLDPPKVGVPKPRPELQGVPETSHILLVGESSLAAQLERWGSLTRVNDLQQAMDYLERHPVSVVVVDKAEGDLRALREVADSIPVLETEATHHPEALFLESILEHLPHMIFVKEAQNLSFIRFNRAGERLVGISREEMIGRNDFDFFPREEAAFFQGKDREVLAKKTLHDIPEETIQTRHGPRLLHTKKIPILDGEGEPLYLLGISEDITDARRTQAAIAAKLETARENERRLVAQELHDELGQLLTGLQLDLAWLQPRLPEELTEHTTSMERLLERTIATVRRLAKRLRPQIVDDLGLVAGLEGLAGEMCERKRVSFSLRDDLGEPRMTEEATIAFFRIGQEALNNVIRHSGASFVEIRLSRENTQICLAIRDNGHGFDPQHLATDSLGILGMRERIGAIGGHLKLSSSPDEGTSVEARAPIERCLL